MQVENIGLWYDADEGGDSPLMRVLAGRKLQTGARFSKCQGFSWSNLSAWQLTERRKLRPVVMACTPLRRWWECIQIEYLTC